MKKAFCLLTCALALAVWAAPGVPARAVDTFDYALLPDGSGIIITKYNGKEAAVVIPAAIDGLPVTAIGEKAFLMCDFIQSVQFPEGLKSIGDNAFRYCKALREPVLPGSLESIGKRAFAEDDTLMGFHIPRNVSQIGDAVVTDCKSLENIVVDPANPFFASVDGMLFSKNLDTLFAYPPGLAEAHVSLPQAVENIAPQAFAGCGMREVSFPAGLKSIGPSAFYACGNLRHAPLPEGLVSVGAGAFSWCSSLEEVTIPASLQEIGPNAFSNLASLPAFEVARSNPVFSAPGGALYNTPELRFVAWPPFSPQTACVIEGGTQSIASSAFQNCGTLTEVTLPEGLLDIGAYAFSNCVGIQKITIPASVTSIGQDAFRVTTVWEKGIKLQVPKPSYAYDYARENGVPYEIVP